MYQKLIKWSLHEFSDLPWRKERTLYRTIVSEIMLQQTTVQTVLHHFERFILQFPDASSLAGATVAEVEIAWKGLGYYRRARNLRLGMIDIVEYFNNCYPQTFDELISIAGIGEYTAHAILAMGHNQKALAIDANIERVLARIYGLEQFKGRHLNQAIKKLFLNGDILEDEVQLYSARALNEALMDLGRVYCKAKSVNCDACFMQKKCKAYASREPLTIPRMELKTKVGKKNIKLELLRIYVKDENEILGVRKEAGEWLEGQIEVPTFIISCEDKSFTGYPHLPSTKKIFKLAQADLMFKTSITKYSISNFVMGMTLEEFLQSPFVAVHAKEKFYLENETVFNLATSTIKIKKALLSLHNF